jgi:hypothetical protein
MSVPTINTFQRSSVARSKAAIDKAVALGAHVHAGLKGQLREILSGELLAPVLPPEVKIGTGQLVSAAGAMSPQSDVILYAPAILPPSLYDEKPASSQQNLALYWIEVKSRLNNTELKDAIHKASIVRKLPLVPTDHWFRNIGPWSSNRKRPYEHTYCCYRAFCFRKRP